MPSALGDNRRGDIAVVLKVAGEILLLAGRGDNAIPRLRMAAALLQAVKDVDVGHLIATCEQLLAFLGEPATSTTATARALPREPQRAAGLAPR